MGRQIQLSMLPADRDALLAEIRSHADVEVVMRDGDSSDVLPLASIPSRVVGTLVFVEQATHSNVGAQTR